MKKNVPAIRIYLITLAALSLFKISVFPGPFAASQKVYRPALTEVLKKAAEQCRKLEEASLFYICEEHITERIYLYDQPVDLFSDYYDGPKSSGFGRKVSTWIYDYQLIRKGPVLDERRNLLNKNGKALDVKDASLETGRFSHKYVVFGPVGLLSEKNQNSFDYEFLETEKIHGELAFIISARPKPTAPAGSLFGKVWLRASDLCVLKIQWDQTSLGNFADIQKHADSRGAIPDVTFFSEYAIEKNGLRFPSRYVIQENYVSKKTTRAFMRSTTTVLYKNYRYFTVEVDVKD